jgi:hypothetical protein
MSFEEMFMDHDERLFEALADDSDAVYTPPGSDPVGCAAIIEHNVLLAPSEGDFNSAVSDTHSVVALRIAQTGKPVKGATILMNGTVYTVGRLIANDGSVAQVVVK